MYKIKRQDNISGWWMHRGGKMNKKWPRNTRTKWKQMEVPVPPVAVEASSPCSACSSPWSSWQHRSSLWSCRWLRRRKQKQSKPLYYYGRRDIWVVLSNCRYNADVTFVNGNQQVQCFLREMGPDDADLLLQVQVHLIPILSTWKMRV